MQIIGQHASHSWYAIDRINVNMSILANFSFYVFFSHCILAHELLGHYGLTELFSD